ncbi:hypothetical protein SAMN06269185_2973 [Natronoarchaeum philippinense]|uniref:DUF7260 domain-containing protein n=1 Tax=Natronoarchaeum philippinense TaxID=558529 RepID=A0A285P6D2_NATPI|nr:hypothetical protein [Natronoarchaeum philippinense]SNZ17295.1 hypothetical protein SAMN06269185_2973 [Natronoarchaeum philippinense]
MGSTQASAGVYRLGEPEFQRGCSDVGCAAVDALSSQAVLVATATVTCLALAALTFLHSAREAGEEERSRVTEERSALERFQRRVQKLSVGAQTPAATGNGGATLARANVAETHSDLRAVKQAYEETVMAVDHYDDDYGEPLAEHMSAEFGDDVAAAVVGGTALTPPVKRALLQKTDAAIDDRTAFLQTLSEESDSVAAASNDLGAIEHRLEGLEDRQCLQQSFPELTEAWEDLDDLEAECREVVARRQDQIQHSAGGADWRDDGHSLCAYLYEPLPVTYPALADGTLLLDRIRTTKRRVADALTRRV